MMARATTSILCTYACANTLSLYVLPSDIVCCGAVSLSLVALVRFEEESSFLRCLAPDVRLFGMVLQVRPS